MAIIELQNEDSLLWWGTDAIKGDAQILLRHMYADFLKQKYGSLEKARLSWQNCTGLRCRMRGTRGSPGYDAGT